MSFELQELGRLNERLNLIEEILGQDESFSETKKKLEAKKAAVEAAKKPIQLTAEELSLVLKAREANKPIELTPEEQAAILAKRAATTETA